MLVFGLNKPTRENFLEPKGYRKHAMEATAAVPGDDNIQKEALASM